MSLYHIMGWFLDVTGFIREIIDNHRTRLLSWLVGGDHLPNRADFKTNNQVTIMIGFCFTQWITLW
jgi:hypothetical protein